MKRIAASSVLLALLAMFAWTGTAQADETVVRAEGEACYTSTYTPEARYTKTIPGEEGTPEYSWSRTVTRSAINVYTPGTNATQENRWDKYTRTATPDKGTKYQYKKTIPEVKPDKEYQFKTEGKYWTVEHKKVKSANNWTTNEINWLKTHATKVGSGSDASSEWQLNDSVVNGFNVNPLTLPQQTWTNLPSGLSAYGGPSSSDVKYYITKSDLYGSDPGGFRQGPFTTTLWYMDKAWVTTNPGSPWVIAGTRDKAGTGTPAYVVYYTGGTPSKVPADAIYVTPAPAGWTQFGSGQSYDLGTITYDPWVKDPTSPYGHGQTVPTPNGTTEPVTSTPGTLYYVDLGPFDIDGTKVLGTWSGWSPLLDLLDGWTGDAPVIPEATYGTDSLPSQTWNQHRTQTETSDVQPDADGGPAWVKGEQTGWKVTPVEPVTVYYVTGGKTSDTLTDANWTTDKVDQTWTLIDKRKVEHKESTECLSHTGFDNMGLVVAAVALMGLGGAALLIGKRRKV